MTSMASTVFIPRSDIQNINPDVLAVLLHAIAGEGSVIATDIIVPINSHITGSSIPIAIVEALRMIGANMISSDQGPLFALALTRGIHRVLTVHSHTPEGGLNYTLTNYPGIPTLLSGSRTSVGAYVDSLALITAALVSRCDPGSWNLYNRRLVPESLCSCDRPVKSC